MDKDARDMPQPLEDSTAPAIKKQRIRPIIKAENSTTTPQKLERGKLKVLFFVVAVIIILAVFFAYLRLKMRKNNPPSIQTVVQEPPLTGQAIQQSQIYTNKKYFYSIEVPNDYSRITLGTDENVKFQKISGEDVSTLQIDLVDVRSMQEVLAYYQTKTKDISPNETVALDQNTKLKKTHISNFAAFEIESKTQDQVITTILVKKGGWLYKLVATTSLPEEVNNLNKMISSLKIYDSEAEFYIDNPN
jgi:hypothetical protein